MQQRRTAPQDRPIRPRQTAKATFAAVVVTMAIAWMWPTQASAQRTRYDRKVDIKVKVKQTKRTKKLKKKQQKSELKPQLTADDFLQVLGKVSHIRKAQTEIVKGLIAETEPTDPELPDLYFRLAELYAQQSRYWNSRGMEMGAKIDVAKGAKLSSYKRKQKGYFRESKKFLIKSIKAYKGLFCDPRDKAAGLNCRPNKNFRNYGRMDTALFYFAFTLQSAKQMTDARKVYARLVKDYPKSKHIPEAFLSFAEYYFNNDKLANAERFYDKVLQFPKSQVYTYALYKKGWVFLNLDRNQEAYEVFTKVAKRTNNKKSKKTINMAAKKDAVRAYAEMGKAQTAYKAFQRIDRKYASTMLQILGNLYMDDGKARKSIYVFRELMGLKPKDKLVCDWEYNVVHAMLSIGTMADKVKEIENLVKLYTYLNKKKALPKANLNECYENAIAVNSEMAKIWHNEAMKTLNIETLAYVERLYHLYLKNFPESSDFGEMQYFYAELLWQRAQNEKNPRKATTLWEKAAGAFTDVVKAGKVKKKRLKDSAYAAVLGWKNALDVDPRPKGVSAPKNLDNEDEKIPKPKEIPERERKMIDAFDIYITYVKDPKDKELVMMKFLKARLYWRYNQFDKALPLFEEIIKKHPNHETGEYSINLLLDTLRRLKKFDKMIYWVNYLLDKRKDLAESNEEMWSRLGDLKRQSMRKAAEQLEKDKKYIACGKAYLDIFNNDPNSDDAHEVLYNSGVCFQDGMSMGAARTMFNILSKRYPKKKVTQKAIARLGYIYGRVAWYDKAAAKLEEYATRFSGEKDAYKALNDAVFYYKGIGEDEKAIKSTQFFVKKYRKKKPAEAANAFYSLVSIYEKKGDKDQVVNHLKKYLSGFGRKGGVDRQILAHVKIGRILWRNSCPLAKTINGACIKVKRERAIASRRRKKRRRRRGITLPTQCGPESKLRTIVRERDKRPAAAARREFAKAIKLFAKGKSLDKVPGDKVEKAARQEQMIEAYAAAKFYMAEKDYEAFLALKFPKGLDFDPRREKKKKKSLKLFGEWMSKKGKLMQRLNADGSQVDPKTKKPLPLGLYREVVGIKGGGADWAIAAAARIGQVAQNFSGALFTVEIPKNVRTGQWAEDKVDAYCDQLTTAAAPLEDLSIGAFTFCLETSTGLNWFNSWSKLCERELGQIRPEAFPTAAELHSDASSLAPITDTEGALLELDAK